MQDPYDRNADLLEENCALKDQLEDAHHRINRLEEDLDEARGELEDAREDRGPDHNRVITRLNGVIQRGGL